MIRLDADTEAAVEISRGNATKIAYDKQVDAEVAKYYYINKIMTSAFDVSTTPTFETPAGNNISLGSNYVFNYTPTLADGKAGTTVQKTVTPIEMLMAYQNIETIFSMTDGIHNMELPAVFKPT